MYLKTIEGVGNGDIRTPVSVPRVQYEVHLHAPG